MPASRKRGIDCVSVGNPLPNPPPKMLEDVDTVKFIIHNFKDRQEKRDEWLESPIAKAHGYEWTIIVYPRGNRGSSTDEVCISTFLHFRGQKSVTASFAFRCKGITYGIFRPVCFHNGKDTKQIKGENKNFKRDDVIKNLLEDDGSLVIECDIKIAAKNKRVWYPKELQQQTFLVELYQDPSFEASDVVFSVEEATFRVHKFILSIRCKILYEIAKDYDNDDVPIQIHSVTAEIFKSILDFVYTVKTPEIEDEATATASLVAADRYECVDLKLYVESVLVDKFLTTANAAALLIFADSYSCALLKEAAINLFVADAETVKKADSWSKIRESNRLRKELLDINTSSKKRVGGNGNAIEQLDVTTLREELAEANLQLDGSREVLIDRLTAHRQDQNQDEDSEE